MVKEPIMRTLTQIPAKKVRCQTSPKNTVKPKPAVWRVAVSRLQCLAGNVRSPVETVRYAFQVNAKDVGDEATEADARLLQDKFSSNLVPFTI